MAKKKAAENSRAKAENAKVSKIGAAKIQIPKPENSKIETWLYHKEIGGKIHLLAPGAPPPRGWRDTPWPEPESGEASKSHRS